MFEQEPDLLTRMQCQQLLQISKSKILEFIHEGWLPARKIAGHYRIEKSDLIEFVRNSVHYT